MNIRLIVVLLLLAVANSPLVQGQVAHLTDARMNSLKAVKFSLTYQVKDSGIWQNVIEFDMVVAEKDGLTIFQQPVPKVNELNPVEDNYQYTVFVNGNGNGYSFFSSGTDSVFTIGYRDILKMIAVLSFDRSLSDKKTSFKLLKQEHLGDSIKIVELIAAADHGSDTAVAFYRKANSRMNFQFSTRLDTLQEMRLEKLVFIDKAVQDIKGPFVKTPRKLIFSTTPIIPAKLEDFEKAIRIYRERSKQL